MSTATMPPDRFESLRVHLVDYLYNEADASTKQAIESAMAESESFSAEVDALARTLRISRRALAVASSPAPSRVRSAVLAAAAEQAARMREAVPVPDRDVIRNEVASDGDAEGALAKFWRWFSRPYAFSLVGAAAVFAIFIMTRGTSAPQLAEEAMRSVAKERSAPAAPATAAAPTEGEPDRDNAGAVATDDKAAPAVRFESEPLGKLARKDGTLGGIGAGKGGGGLEFAMKRPRKSEYAEPPQDWNEASKKPSPRPILKELGGKSELKLDDAPASGAAAGRSADAESVGSIARQKPEASPAPVAPGKASLAPAAPSQEPPGYGSEKRSAKLAPRREAPAAQNAAAEAMADAVQEEDEAQEQESPALMRKKLLARAKMLESAKSYDEAAEVWAELVRRFPQDPEVSAWKKASAAARNAATAQ